jgi:hypothetical protein
VPHCYQQLAHGRFASQVCGLIMSSLETSLLRLSFAFQPTPGCLRYSYRTPNVLPAKGGRVRPVHRLNRRSPDCRLRESGSLIRGHSVIALSRVAGALFLQRIDCEVRSFSSSWACYLVFKDRAACTARDLCATVAALGFSGFESTAGPHSLFEAAFSVKLLFGASRLRLVFRKPPPVLRASFFRGEAASTSSPSFLSTLPFPALFLLCPAQPSAALAPPVRLPLRSRGRGFYHHRVGSQPTSSTPYSVFQQLRQLPDSRPSFCRRGAASTTAAFGVNRLR